MSHTGFDQTLRELGRIGTNVRKSLVDEVLPEHFRIDYPNLVTFLEAYYEHLDSADNFGGIIQELQTVRDIEDTKLEYLDLMFDEVALGVSQATFTFPREAIRNFGNFFRVKGSEYSVEGFFRAFFQENIEIIHPKDRLLRVGVGTIGDEDRFRIQDGALYQIFSTLIRSPIPLSDWETLYRNFVHPSGFYLGAEVVIEGTPQVTIGTAQSIVDLRANVTSIFQTASAAFEAQGEVVGAVDGAPLSLAPLYDGLDSDQLNPDALLYMQNGYVQVGYASLNGAQNLVTHRMRDRYSLYRNINDYQGLSIADVEKYYSSLYEWAGFYKSWDDAADSANASAIRFSATLDDFSAAHYVRY
jgi:hypothetical protein